MNDSAWVGSDQHIGVLALIISKLQWSHPINEQNAAIECIYLYVGRYMNQSLTGHDRMSSAVVNSFDPLHEILGDTTPQY
jgi:hypothetical protein